MKILTSSFDYKIIIDTEETNLLEWLMCLEKQYPSDYDDMEEGVSLLNKEFIKDITKVLKRK
jgi:hypothetical protein